MLKHLHLENAIKYKNADFDFKKGTTLICGENGSGKSLIQEFIRFALFGSQALRGKVSDYPQDMKVELDFTISGVEHKIKRTINDCNFDNIVSGTKPCNKAIIETLGYNMEVFDMGNCSKQFEITALGKMKPSDRKAAIDQLIGVDVVDKIIKELKVERSEKTGVVNGIKSTMIEPEEPVKPENYRDVNELRKEIDLLRNRKNEIESVEAICKAMQVEKPIWNGEIPKFTTDDVFLYNKIKEKLLVMGDIKPQICETSEELDSLRNASRMWENWEVPYLSIEQIEKEQNNWIKYKAWKNGKKTKCPKCGYEFTIGVEEFKEEPRYSEEELSRQLMYNKNQPDCEKPIEPITAVQYIEQQSIMKKNKEIKELLEEERKYEGIDEKNVYAYKEYKDNCDKYKMYEYQAKKLDELLSNGPKPTDTEIKWLETIKDSCVIYDARIESYVKQKLKFEEDSLKVKELEDDLKDLECAINGLDEFKKQVKISVIPSLSRVASELVAEMTEGKFDKVEIDEDFNILVNGKEIYLLSGSEEAVANLAIRLGLSSVLTRKVFNVFIGDEIDASMSEERAEKVCESLDKLKSQIEQIILISHKHIECDNIIEVGDKIVKDIL